MLSQSFVLRRSKNFTSNGTVRMPPSVPINHYLVLRKPTKQNRGPIPLFHATLYKREACFEHSNFFKVNLPDHRNTQLRAPRRHRPTRTTRPVLAFRPTNLAVPISNYELFNRNNLNIHFWSWNYRGCWHQTCPPMDTR